MKLSVLALFPALFTAVPANAQDIPMALDPTTMIGFAGTVAADQYARRDYGQRIARAPAISTPNGAGAVRRLSYIPVGTVRQQVHGRVLERMRKIDPDGAAKLAPMLKNGSFDRQAAAYLARYGMSPGNVADTTALFLVSSWLATRASDADPSRGQLLAVRNQVAAAMASTPAMLNASNAMKQEIAEANLIQAVITGQFATAASRDPKLAPGVRSATAKGVMSSYGIDLLRLNLTAQGLR